LPLRRSVLITLLCVVFVAALVAVVNGFVGRGKPKIDFNTQIRPILNKQCIGCHGGVKQSGGFSVLFREEALGNTESGKPAIIPGHPEKSEFIRRLLSHDPDERMPLEKDPLPQHEIALLKQWIREGAVWDDHWAFKKPVLPALPSVTTTPAQHLIDLFILEKLEEKGLSLSPPAGKETLLRRVSLDVIGKLPDSLTTAAYYADTSESAYAQLVDRLLGSPAYGEKWAGMWLDLSRYADSKGYEKDKHRDMWPFRDWLIRALNQDKPYDAFITDLLAGDLLNDARKDELIATAFHRSTMSNDEGGTDDEEYRIASVMDRVNTTFEVFQGITMACTQCHSHPYEPIRHDEYYKFLAYFNNSADADLPSDAPLYRDMYTPDNEKKAKDLIRFIRANTSQAYDINNSENIFEARRNMLLPLLEAEDCDDYNYGSIWRNAIVWDEDGKYYDGKNYIMYRSIDLTGYSSITFHASSSTGHASIECRIDSLNGPVIGKAPIAHAENQFRSVTFPIQPAAGKHDLYFVLRGEDLNQHGGPGNFDWFRLDGKPQIADAAIRKAKDTLVAIPRVNLPVMQERNRSLSRETRVFERGSFLTPGKPVLPAVPEIYHASSTLSPDRMGVAQWLTSADNPLTARVAVNRLWEQLFGKGIVETLEDFGSQGARPSHPELLDWMSIRFMKDYRWSVKKMLREIVMSDTYRQSAIAAKEKTDRDPGNVYLSYFPKSRLSAEQLRDLALDVSGLLSGKMYGPSVMPYQPEGTWMTVYSASQWKTSEGADRHRRSVYTYWKRTSPYPSFLTFDAPSREVCTSRRIRTNTPLQALVTMNDTVYLEAAIALADRLGKNFHGDISSSINNIYTTAIGKQPSVHTAAQLKILFDDAVKYYARHPALISSMTTGRHGTKEQAALSVVANAVLNLDEFITKS